MSDLELRVRVQAEVAAARAEIAAVRADVVALGQSIRTAMSSATTSNKPVVDGFEALRASIDPAFAAAKRYQDIQSQVAAMVASGEVSQRAANVVLEQAASRYMGVATAAERSAAAQQEETARAIAQEREIGLLTQSYTNLRGSVDPLYAATMRFADAQELARLAVANGITTQDEAARTLDTLAQKLGLTGQSLSQMHGSSGMAAAASANLAYQFNDVAVMAAAGQSPLMIAIQQGTQIGQEFGRAGAAGAVELLKGGFMAFLNPTTLVTIALIAGGAALVQWAMGAGDAESAVDDLDRANARMRTGLDTINSIAKNLSTDGLADLIEKYGEVDATLLTLMQHQREFAERSAIQGARDAISALRSEYGQLLDKIGSGTGGRGATNDLATQLGVSKDRAVELRDALNDASAATTFAGRAEALGRINDILSSSAISGSDMALAILTAQDSMLQLDVATAKADDAMGHAHRTGDDLLNVLKAAWDAVIGLSDAAPDSGWLDGAIGDARTLGALLWDAAVAADAAKTSNPTVTRVPGGLDAIARGEVNLSGRNVNGGMNVTRRLPPVVENESTDESGLSSAPRSGVRGLTAQAGAVITDLDLAIAAINEKVRAGLMTTSQAADAVMGAKDQAATSLADLVARLDQLGPAGAAAANSLRSNMNGLAADLKATGSDLAATLSEGFKSPFKEFLKGTVDAQGALKSLGDMFIDTMARMAADQAAAGFIKPVLNTIFADVGSLFPFADGGVPDAPLSAYRNQVLDRPTMFPMARGMGLMAEAGAEAIMPVGDGGILAMIGGREARLPLTRGAGGRLGVEVPDLGASIMERPPVAFAKGGIISGGQAMRVSADAGGGPGGGDVAGRDRQAGPVIVNVTTPAGHTARVDERRGSAGELNIDIMVELIENRMAGNLRSGRGAHAAAMADAFGLDRRPR